MKFSSADPESSSWLSRNEKGLHRLQLLEQVHFKGRQAEGDLTDQGAQSCPSKLHRPLGPTYLFTFKLSLKSSMFLALKIWEAGYSGAQGSS